ncbi:MAG TPA: GTP cyclohydrolase II, partial [Fimbriimonadaceae bacterium]|nr:GTP cyclohydrolase II [Fimbriimonadaceae bacterium]
MTKQNTTRLGTAMAEMVDALHGTTTGVSAHDRAATVAVFVDDSAKPSDLGRPGHIIPLRAEKGGVLRRAGHTEASVDLCLLAGFKPVAVGCEILSDDGTMMRLAQLQEFAREHDLKIITIADLIAYRRKHELLVKREAGPIAFPTKHGVFALYAYTTTVEPHPYIAIVKGDVCTEDPVLVRVHSSCLTGDLLGSLRCDCGDQLAMALEKLEEEGRGVVLYIAQEGRGIGLINKLKAYELQDQGLDTVEANQALGFKADLRDYGLGAQVLADLGLRKLKLMTNNPAKVAGLQGYGLEIVEHVPLLADPADQRQKYLETKKNKLGHWMPER